MDLISEYRGNTSSIQSAVQTEEEQKRVDFIRDRYVYMSLSKSVLESKYQLEKQFYDVFLQHLTTGEVWNNPYRFPEMFGSIQRKATDLIDNMPECKVHATRDKAKDFSIALQATLDHCERMSAVQREKIRMIYDTLFYGTGVLYEGYTRVQREITPVDGDELELAASNRVLTTLYEGLVSERIDIRDFFVDETAYVFYDEANIQGARDCIRRRSYPYSTFKERFKGFKNANNIVPISWGSDPFGRGKQPFQKESQEQKTIEKYVIVLEYWNVELDMLCLVANGIEIYYGANPFKHKRLPFVLYYNYRRDDSLWGISEIEINAPFVYAKEEIRNLMITDAKLALQPALAVSGDVMFNPEEEELEPGAVFTLRGLNGGKVQDAIMPLRFAGVPPEAFQVLTNIEDQQTIATGDDTRALYSNPKQLATQTLSKRESQEKRIKSSVMQNTMESERDRVMLKISNIIQYYATPYMDMNGKVCFRRIKIEGYQVHQDNDEAKPEFKQSYGAIGHFTLNSETFGNPGDIEVEVVDVQLTEMLKRDEMDDLNQFLSQAINLMQVNPQVMQELNVVGIVKQMAKKMDLDYDEIFPAPAGEEGKDAIDYEIDLILLGQVPPFDPNQDSIEALERYRLFMQTDTYKNSPATVKIAMQQLNTLTLKNAPNSIIQKLQAYRQFNSQSHNGQNPMAMPGQFPQQGGGQGFPQVPRGNLPAGGQQNPQPTTPAVRAPRGVATRLGFSNAETSQTAA